MWDKKLSEEDGITVEEEIEALDLITGTGMTMELIMDMIMDMIMAITIMVSIMVDGVEEEILGVEEVLVGEEISEVEEVLEVEEIVVEEEVEEIVAEEENDFNEIIILLYISQMRIRKSKDRIFRYETHSLCFRKDLTSKFCPCLIC